MTENSTMPSDANKPLPEDDQWLKDSLNQHLNAKVDQLDFTVTSKLAAARHRALEQNIRQSSNWLGVPAASAGVAVLALAVFISGKFYSPAPPITAPTSARVAQSDFMEDLPLLAAADDIEFYQSIEFLEWMEKYSS